MTCILVLGAGELGLAILKALSQHPSRPQTSVLLRPSTSTSRHALLDTLQELDISVIEGDLTSEDLYTKLEGFDIVISATGFAGGVGTQRHIAQSALKSKVPWFVPWQFGVDYDKISRGSSQPLFDEQLDVRDLLRGQNEMKWTIISTGIFTSFLFDPAFGVVEKTSEREVKVTALGKWDNEITMTGADDIGVLTAGIVLDDAKRESGVEYVAGDTTSFQELAEALEQEGWEVKKELITMDELQREREQDPEANGPKYQLIWARNVGVSWPVDSTWNARRGITVETMREWINKNFAPR